MKISCQTYLILLATILATSAIESDVGLGLIPVDPVHQTSEVTPASQQNSKVSKAEIDSYYNNIIEGNQLEEMPTEYRNQIPSLAKHADFDIDRFLNDIDEMDCDDTNAEHNKDEKYKKLCAQRLTEDTFRPLGEYSTDHNNFFDYLNNNIYMPLAYNMNRPQSLSNSIIDLVFLNNKNALFEGRPVHTNYKDFEKSIFSLFSRVEGSSSNVDQNQELISELMIAILKRFHLYWNQLRFKDQVDKIKVDTKDIMRNILKEYMVKEKFLFEVTKTLVEHIKSAYMRFMKAHMSVRILNKTAPSMVSHAIIERYEKLLDVIKFSQFTDIKLVREITYLLDLQEAFYVVNYKIGVNEPRSMLEFQTEVMENIQHSYNFYIGQLTTTDKESLIEIRNFTATLLLKMKHMEHIIFRFHSITEFVNMSKTMIYERDPVMVKLYYEILDNMLTIPKKCVNFLVLKNCALHETNKLLRFIASKYMLKRSNKGWLVFDYTQNVLRHLFSRANDLVFSNWTVFKSYFYQNLFSVMYNFKKRYYIGDEDCVEDLENMIGTTLDTFKIEEASHHIDFGIIDQLDKDLYDKFLDIKGFYNKFAPFEKDLQVASSIENDLTVFFVEFKSKYKNAISEDFIRLLGLIKTTVDKWRAAMMSSDELSIQVGTLPISMGPISQVFNTVVQSNAIGNNSVVGSIPENNSMDPYQSQFNSGHMSESEKNDINEQSPKNVQNQENEQNIENNNKNDEEHVEERSTRQVNFKDNNDELKAIKSIRNPVENPHTIERSLKESYTAQNDPAKLDISQQNTVKLIDQPNSSKKNEALNDIPDFLPSPTKFSIELSTPKQDMTIKEKVPDVWSLDNLIPNHAVLSSVQDSNRDQGFENGIYFK